MTFCPGIRERLLEMASLWLLFTSFSLTPTSCYDEDTRQESLPNTQITSRKTRWVCWATEDTLALWRVEVSMLWHHMCIMGSPVLMKHSTWLKKKYFSKGITRTSLVVQQLRILLPMQGTQVQSLVQEDSSCHGATKSMYRKYWACALDSRSHNCWSLHSLEPALHHKRSHCKKKPRHCNCRGAPAFYN